MASNYRKKAGLWNEIDPVTRRPDRSIGRLSVDAKAVLGILWSCRKYSAEEMATILFLPRSHVSALLKQIYRSSTRTVRDALVGRFGVNSIVDIPTSGMRIRCKRCNQVLCKVPCCKCLVDSLKTTKTPEESEDLPESGEPTNAMPGSEEKMRIMQDRLAAGFSAFCTGDRDVTNVRTKVRV